MKITDHLLEEILHVYMTHPGDTRQALRAALGLIPAPLPIPPTLRPIAEMTEIVPEGCVRMHGFFYSPGELSGLTKGKGSQDTLFIDIRLPVESAEDKMRKEFEKGMQERGHILRRKEETYDEPIHHFAWVGFKLAKSAIQP